MAFHARPMGSVLLLPETIYQFSEEFLHAPIGPPSFDIKTKQNGPETHNALAILCVSFAFVRDLSARSALMCSLSPIELDCRPKNPSFCHFCVFDGLPYDSPAYFTVQKKTPLTEPFDLSRRRPLTSRRKQGEH